jgi:outer membrane usher protein
MAREIGRHGPRWAFAPAILLGVMGFFAVCSAVAVGPAEERAVVTLRVNGVDARDIIVILRGRDILLPVAELEATGVRGVAGARETIDGQTHVSLLSLVPDIRFALDEKELVLRLAVPPAYFGSTALNLETGPPDGILYSTDSSAFFNYAVRWSRDERFSGFAEGGWSHGRSLLYSSVLRNTNGSFVRGLSHFDVDERSRLRRWTLGDGFADTGELGGGAFLGGISLSRNFGLDPYFVRFPRFGLAGAVSTPSTVDVYVNGALVRREQLPPGQFDLQNIPIVAGSGAVSLVVRDVFGQERAITSPYYFSTGLLAAGLSDYSYNLGFVRRNLGKESGDYGGLLFLARHRAGLTNAFTAGGRLEAASHLVSGGTSITARLPVGEIDLAAAASREKGQTGGAASLAYSYVGSPVSVGAIVSAMTDNYANASLPAGQNRPNLEERIFLGTQVARRVSVSMQYSSASLRDGGHRAAVSVAASVQVTRQASLLVSGGRSRDVGKDWTTTLFAGLTYLIGPSTTANLTFESTEGKSASTAEVQSPLPRGTGLGYRLQLRGREGENAGLALLQYQSPFGRYEFSYDRLGGKDATSISAAGGIVAIGGALHATRPVQESYALLRVPGVPGVRGFLSNQEVGHTDGGGDLLVPDLLSYFGNRLSIADRDVPLDFSIDATERVVAPPFRGGALVSFPVRRIRTVTGTVVIEKDGRELVPSFGQLIVSVEAEEIISPIGRGGEFYLEILQPGQRDARIEYRDGTCRFLIQVPDSQQTVVNLGKVVCRLR